MLEEGEVAAGDLIERIERDETSLSEVCRLLHLEHNDRDAMRRAAQLPKLTLEWRNSLLQRLET